MSEWNAGEYAKHSSLQQAMAEEQLRLLKLAGSERILDVGCGDGKVTAAIAARVPTGTVVGVDPSRGMIAFASAHHSAPNLRFEVADARCLPFRGEFDRVVSFNALHWVKDQDAALASIRAALGPSGHAQLRLVPAGTRRSVEYLAEEVRQEPRWAEYFVDFTEPFAHFTPDEYHALAERNGFRVTSLEVHDRRWDFGDREAFAAFCGGIFSEWTRVLPESDRPEFVREVSRRYCELSPCGGRGTSVFGFFQMDVELAAI